MVNYIITIGILKGDYMIYLILIFLICFNIIFTYYFYQELRDEIRYTFVNNLVSESDSRML